MNIKNSQQQTVLKGALIALVASAALPQLASADEVYLNNQPLATSVAPIQRNGRTLVPMRDIFEALGAQITYNPKTQSVLGTRGTTTVNLTMGNRTAYVNQQPVTLDTAPTIYNGRTLVPLRFVSEALGARVGYDPQRLIVSVTTNGNAPVYAQNPGKPLPSGGSQVAGARTISVPAGVVVPVTLDSALSSATARKGDRFSATVVSTKDGDSEFPSGTRLEGVVRDVAAKSGDNPGVLDLDFRAAVLPDGTRYPLQSQLIDINDAKQVDNDGRGRITAGGSSDSKDRLKVIGIGAAAGYGLGKVLLKKNGALSAILGGAAGYLYNKKSGNKVREAKLDAGAKLGVRPDSPLVYNDGNNYSQVRQAYTTS